MLSLKNRLLKSGLSSEDIKLKFIDLRIANNRRSAEQYLKNIECTDKHNICLGAKPSPASTTEYINCLIYEREVITVIYDNEDQIISYMHGCEILPFNKISVALRYLENTKKIFVIYIKHLYPNGYFYYDWIYPHFLSKFAKKYQEDIINKINSISKLNDVIYTYADEDTNTYYFFNKFGTIKQYNYNNLFESNDSVKERINFISWYDLSDYIREKILNSLLNEDFFKDTYENIFLLHIYNIDLGAKPNEKN